MDYLFLKAKWFRKSGSGGEKVHFRALAPGQVIKLFALIFFHNTVSKREVYSIISASGAESTSLLS